MFVGVARVGLQIPDSGSLKAKRQILRRVTDRVKARFNASVAEVNEQDLWQRATLAVAVVGNESRHVNEQLDKIVDFIDEMYVAPLISREVEILPLGDRLFGGEGMHGLPIARGDRSLAEAEGMADWEKRFEAKPSKSAAAQAKKQISLDEARAKARSLRNPRDWEKK
jgi:uncharacterized protein YlxP (DUF503 family)